MYSNKQALHFLKRIGRATLSAALGLSVAITQLGAFVPEAKADTGVIEGAPLKVYIPTYHVTGNSQAGSERFNFYSYDMANDILSADPYEAITSQTDNSNRGDYTGYAVDPAGQYIAMASYSSASDKTDLHLIDTVTGTTKTLKTGDFWPLDVTFSADGSQAIFMGNYFDPDADSDAGQLKIVAVDMSKLGSAVSNQEHTWKKEIYIKSDITYPSRIISAGDYFYVAYDGRAQETGKIAVFNAATHALVKTIDLEWTNLQSERFEVGKVTQLLVDPTGVFLYAFSRETRLGRDNSMAKIALSNNTMNSIIELNQMWDRTVTHMTISPNGKYFYVTYGSNNVHMFESSNGGFHKNISIDFTSPDLYGYNVYQVGISPDGLTMILHLSNGTSSYIRTVTLDSISFPSVVSYSDRRLSVPSGVFLNHRQVVLNFPAHYLQYTYEAVLDDDVIVEGNQTSLTVKNKIVGTELYREISDWTGKTFQLSADDTSVVQTFNNGTVNGLKYGKTRIKVELWSGYDLLYDTYADIKVNPNLNRIWAEGVPTEVFVGDEITFDVKGYSMTTYLTYHLYPEDVDFTSLTAFTYVDQDGKLIADTDGTVTESVYGRAQVQVEAFGKQTTVEFDVKMAPFSGLALADSSITLEVGDTYDTVVNAVYRNYQKPYVGNLTFESGNTSVATVDVDGKVTAKAAGNAVITVTPEGGHAPLTMNVVVTTSGGGGNDPGNGDGNGPGAGGGAPGNGGGSNPGNGGGNNGGGNNGGGNGNAPVDETPQEGNTDETEQPVEETVQPGPIQFSDTQHHWAEASIIRAVQMGIVKGFTDGTFRPDVTVSRGEFAVMLQRALHLEAKSESSFADSSKIPAWAKESVDAVSSHGYITGFPDGTFGSEQSITRVQLAVIIARMLDISSDAKPPFTDAADIPAWAAKEIAAVAELGIMVGLGDGSFAPNKAATRAEALEVLLRVLDYLESIAQ